MEHKSKHPWPSVKSLGAIIAINTIYDDVQDTNVSNSIFFSPKATGKGKYQMKLGTTAFTAQSHKTDILIWSLL